jgi:hypothetical protein
MPAHRISHNNGSTWMGITPPLQFDLLKSDIHFFRKGKDSFLQIASGNTILQLFITDSFWLKANASLKLTIGIDGPQADIDSKFIDFGSPSSGFLIASNGGGIGIADIRDGAVVLDAVVFSLVEVQVYFKKAIMNTGEVELLFSPSGSVTFIP